MTGNFLSGAWAVSNLHEGAIRAALQGQLFRPNALGFDAAMLSALNLEAADYSYEKAWIDYLSMGKAADVPVIPIYGTMSRGYSYDNYFSNTFIMKLLAKAAEDESKKGVILDVNSGGGTVDSTDELAAMIRAVDAIKPVVARVSFCASAALWVTSQSREIVISQGPLTKIGSIGTIYIHVNVAKALAQQGYDVQIFRSTGSVDKARLNSIEPLDPELEKEIIRDLDASNKAFKGDVRTGRGAKITSDEIYTGKVYNSADGIRLGLADRTGDLNTAYKRVIQLAS